MTAAIGVAAGTAREATAIVGTLVALATRSLVPLAVRGVGKRLLRPSEPPR